MLKVTTTHCDFNFRPKLCLCMVSFEIIDGFQPFFIYFIIVTFIKIYQICPSAGHRFKCFNVQQKLQVGMYVHQRLRSVPCADPESFVRGGPTFPFFVCFFKLDERRKYQIKWAIIGTPAKRHLNGR